MKKYISLIVLGLSLVIGLATVEAQITYEVDPVDNKIGIITEPQPNKIDRVTVKAIRAKIQAARNQITHLNNRRDNILARKAKWITIRDNLIIKRNALLALGVTEEPTPTPTP